jgi:hypothetical protein
MNKLKNEMLCMKIQINSSYGLSGKGDSLYQEYFNKKEKFYKIQSRILKIKKLYESI